MHASPRWTDEGAFEVDAQDFGLGRAAVRNAGLGARPHPGRDAGNGVAGALLAGRDGGGHKRRRATPRDLPGDSGKSVWRALHYVTAAGAVDVDIHEAGRDGEVARFPPGGGRRYGDLIARTHGDNLLAVNDDHGVVYFLARRERAADKNG